MALRGKGIPFTFYYYLLALYSDGTQSYATTGDPRVAKRNDFPPASEVNMSGKLPGAKQQFRIPFRSEPLE